MRHVADDELYPRGAGALLASWEEYAIGEPRPACAQIRQAWPIVSADLYLVRSIPAASDSRNLSSAEVDQPSPQTDMEGT